MTFPETKPHVGQAESATGGSRGQMTVHPLHGSQATSVRQAFAGKHVLVTGVTGFLGKVWLSILLQEIPEIGRVYLLVRGRKRESAISRVENMFATSPVFRALRAKYGQDLSAFLSERISVIDGDVVRPMCGVEPLMVHELAPVEFVVHFAGLVDFEPDPEQALSINVKGALHVADLVKKLPRAKLIHVSTCFVAGNVSGDIPERIDRGVSPKGKHFDPHAELEMLDASLRATDAHDSRDAKKHRIDLANKRAEALGWPNIYTYTKGLAEHLLAGLDVPHIIVRPSIVECAVRTPFAGWNEGINTSGPLYWLLESPFRRLPSRSDHRFDVVPVDAVARGCFLAALAVLNGEGGVMQLASSVSNPFTFGRAIELTALSARKAFAKDDASAFERLILRRLDAVSAESDKDFFPTFPLMRRSAKALREALTSVDVDDRLGPFFSKLMGDKLEDGISRASRTLNRADRTLSSVESMLKLYRPFIHDHDYAFHAERVAGWSARLVDTEKSAFGWDVESLNWRQYWMDIQGPGLRTWCYPLLRNEKVPDDAPMEGPALRLDPRVRTEHHERRTGS